MDELQTIKAVQNGDRDAYAPLVERYWTGLVIYCEQITQSRDDAEDIAQRAFIKAYDHINSFDSAKSRFSTWLYKIAKNTAIDTLRSVPTTIEYDDELNSTGASYDPVSSQHSDDEQRQLIRNKVATLQPDEQRRVIEGYYWEGKSYQQLADELQVPINTIKTWIHRAKKQLRENLS